MAQFLPWAASKSTSVLFRGFAFWRDLNGPEGGNIRHLFWCPIQSGHLWASTYAGDIFCLNNLQSDWRRCSPPFSPRRGINALEAIPGAIPRILASGADEGLFATENLGVSWINVSSAFHGRSIQILKHHPIYPGFAFAACQNDLFYTADGGLNWNFYPVNFRFNTITAIAISPSNPLRYYVADASGIQCRLYKTDDGGQSFQLFLDGSGKFWRIHTIIEVPSSEDTYVAGFGGNWGIARHHTSSNEPWSPMNKGLPFSRISCLTLDDFGNFWAGSDGNGLYRYDASVGTWYKADTADSRKYVKCLDARGTQIAAGFGGTGVAIRNQDIWHFHNRKLTAGSVDVATNPSGRQVALVNNEIQMRLGEQQWNQVLSMRYVQDIAAGNTSLLAACQYDGVFLQETPDSGWLNTNLPNRAAARVCVSADEKTYFALAIPPGSPILVFQKHSNQSNWHALGSGISGPFEIFQLTCACDGTWSVVSTVAGIYWFDPDQQRWRLTEKNPAFEIRAVASSSNDSKKLYAGSGEYLIYSMNAGQSFEPGYLFHFPSGITSIWTSGTVWETIYVGTAGGGLYASYCPGIWHNLLPQETGISFSSVRTANAGTAKLILATNGISCCTAEVPGIKIKSLPDPQIDGHRRIFLTLSNPCGSMKVNLHLIQLPPGNAPIYYAFQNGILNPCPDPQPYEFTLESNTSLPESYIGSIQCYSNASLIAGLLDEQGNLPVGPIDGVLF
jgi:hypothetical protein